MSPDEPAEESSVYELLNTSVYPAIYRPFEKLSEFLKEERSLFTLIGVFGAITIYARTAIQNASSLPNRFSIYAIGAGFSTIILLSILILSHLWVDIRDANRIVSVENWGLIVFASFFTPLTGILAVLISQYGSFWSPYAVFILLLIGVLVPILSVFLTGVLVRKVATLFTDFRPEYPEYLSMSVASLLIFYYIALQTDSPRIPGSVSDFILFDWIGLLISFIQLTSFLVLPMFAVAFSFLSIYLTLGDLGNLIQNYIQNRKAND